MRPPTLQSVPTLASHQRSLTGAGGQKDSANSGHEDALERWPEKLSQQTPSTGAVSKCQISAIRSTPSASRSETAPRTHSVATRKSNCPAGAAIRDPRSGVTDAGL